MIGCWWERQNVDSQSMLNVSNNNVGYSHTDVAFYCIPRLFWPARLSKFTHGLNLTRHETQAYYNYKNVKTTVTSHLSLSLECSSPWQFPTINSINSLDDKNSAPTTEHDNQHDKPASQSHSPTAQTQAQTASDTTVSTQDIADPAEHDRFTARLGRAEST